jgi:hypothetical protein
MRGFGRTFCRYPAAKKFLNPCFYHLPVVEMS